MNSLHDMFSRYLAPLVRRYSRLETTGEEHLPPAGRPALLACNHAGGMWWDAACLAAGVRERRVHFVAHHWDASIPLFRRLLEAIGSVFLAPSLRAIGADDPAVRALRQGRLLCQYPEESYHTYRDRYTLFRFCPQLIKYAHLAGAPIVPTAVIGAEEAAPIYFGIKRPGIPSHIPLHPPLVLPFKITIEFGRPLAARDLLDRDDAAAASDADYQRAADRLRERLRAVIGRHHPCHVSDVRYIERRSWW